MWNLIVNPYLALTSISPRHALRAKMMRSAFQVVVSQLSLYSTSGMKLKVILLHEYVRPCTVHILKL